MALTQSFSGIRGIYGEDFTLDVVRKYVLVYLDYLKKSSKKNNLKIVVGEDTRHSSYEIKKEIIKILDCDIINVGISSTPMVQLAVRHYKADGGIIITASHNPKEYNGFKFLGKDGAVLRPKDIAQVIAAFNEAGKDEKLLKKINKNISKHHSEFSKKIIDKKEDIREAYAEFCLKLLGKKNIDAIKKSGISILLDPNGGTGFIIEKVLDRLKINYSMHNRKLGVFNRAIEPNNASLHYLKGQVIRENYSLAAGFDCDADRVEIIDNEGGIVSGQYVLALITDLFGIDKKLKGKTIVTNDATSGIVKEIAEKYKAKTSEVEVGEINVVDSMQKCKSPLGGEGSSSGAIIPPSKCRDGILAVLFIMALIARKKKTLSKILDTYPVYHTLRENIGFEPENHDEIKRSIENYYKNKKLKLAKTGGITGGLKVFFTKDSFLWFRASKTEGASFRIMADSKNKAMAEKMLEEGAALVNGFNDS